jgi:hypothetical protein
MTGLNVASTIPGDSFVLDKIDNLLTASLPDSAAGIIRGVSTTRSPRAGHLK